MRWIIRGSGATRKRFSRLPHWAKDIYGLLSYANFIELIPTLVSIAIAPRHFFRRLPRTLSGASPHYTTPVKFFFNFAAFFLAVFFLRHGDLSEIISHSSALWYLPAILPMTPPTMIALGIISWVLYQIPRLAPNGDAFPPPNHGPFKLLLSPFTYLSLDHSKFVWGLFYISVYFLAVWQFVQVLVAVDFLGVVYLVDALGEGHIVPKAITILLGIAIVAFCIHGMVLHPYMEMLRASLRHPTRCMFETDVHEIRQSTNEFLAIRADDASLSAQANLLYEVICQQLDCLQILITQQNIDFDLSEAEIHLRLQVHRDALQVEALRDHLQHVSKDVRQKFSRLLSSFDAPVAQAYCTAA
jgi:hypothetical protein